MATKIKNPYLMTFIHIPKTGGNSITEWMKTNFIAEISKGGQHATVGEAEKLLGNLGWTFCVVRNPWDYCVSWYTFKIYIAKTYIDILTKQPELINPKRKKYRLEHHQNQLERLNNGFDWWVRQTNVAKQSKYAKNVDYFCRLENLDEDFKVIQNKLNCYEPLPLINKTPNRTNYKDYYTPETIEIVREKFQEDIEFLNYEY